MNFVEEGRSDRCTIFHSARLTSSALAHCTIPVMQAFGLRLDEAIVRAVINLGRSLGIRVVAEGIEAEPQAARLLDLGCDFGQGFAFSPAIGANRVPTLIRRLSEAARDRRKIDRDRRLRLVAN